jgi:hypothetical protein
VLDAIVSERIVSDLCLRVYHKLLFCEERPDVGFGTILWFHLNLLYNKTKGVLTQTFMSIAGLIAYRLTQEAPSLAR